MARIAQLEQITQSGSKFAKFVSLKEENQKLANQHARLRAHIKLKKGFKARNGRAFRRAHPSAKEARDDASLTHTLCVKLYDAGAFATSPKAQAKALNTSFNQIPKLNGKHPVFVTARISKCLLVLSDFLGARRHPAAQLYW